METTSVPPAQPSISRGHPPGAGTNAGGSPIVAEERRYRNVVDHLDGWPPVIVLGLVAATVLLYRLGSQSLADWDEAIYARISQEILERREWLTLHWEGRPYLRKPPLFMWTTAVFFGVFGVSEFWARAASAISGIAVVLLTFVIGRRVYGAAVGLLGALVLLTSYQFVASARFGTTDVMLSLQFLLALYAYLRVQQGEQRWWLLVWLAAALAFMVKSAAGLLAPLAVFTGVLLDGKLQIALRSRYFWTGAVAAAVIVLPWHILMLWQHGAAFVDQYIGHSIVERATGVIDGHAGGRMYYVQRLYWYFFPWVLLAPLALVVVTRDVLLGSRRSRVLLVAAVLVFALFTFAETKLRWYILPLYPLLALFVARLLWQAVRQWRSFGFSALLFGFAALLLTAPLRAAIVLAVAAALISPLLMRRRQLAAAGAIAAFALVGAFGLQGLYEAGESPLARLAALAGQQLRGSEHHLMVYHGLYRPAALFYSGHPIEVVGQNEDLASRIGSGDSRHILLYQRDLASLADRFEFRVLAEDWELVYAIVTLPAPAGGS